MKRCLFSRGPVTLRRGFTLVEMLVVMGIIVILIALVTPAVKGLRGSGDFTAATGGIASTLEQARAYAMANNTYVYVGVGEFDVTESTAASPRSAGTGKVGQIVVAVVAARDGTRGYDINNAQTSWPTYYANKPFPLQAIDKLHVYNNVHLADLSKTTQTPNSYNDDPSTGNMSRPVTPLAQGLGNDQYRSDNSLTFVTPFSWPLGQALGSGQYQFTKVIQFDPQGVARMQFASNTDNIASGMEIYLQPTNGSIAPAAPATSDAENTGNQAAITVDCMTGSVRIYRP